MYRQAGCGPQVLILAAVHATEVRWLSGILGFSPGIQIDNYDLEVNSSTGTVHTVRGLRV